MAGTASGRNIRYRIVFCDCVAAGTCQKSCLAADADFFDRRRHFKFFFRKVFVDPLHYLLPQFSVETPVACRNLRLNVVSGPDSGSVVRGEAREHQVRVIVCGTGFSGNSHAVDLAGGSGTSFHNVFHRAGQQICGALTEDLGTLTVGVVEDHIAVTVCHFGVQDRLVVGSSVGDCRVGAGQFQIADTVGQTAEGDGLMTALGWQKLRKSEFCQIIVSCLRCDLRQDFDRRNIVGMYDCFAYGYVSVVSAVCVADRSAVLIGVWLVLDHRGKGDRSGIQRRTVSGKWFERRSRLTVTVRRAVQRQAGSLLSETSDECLYITGGLVDDGHACLRLHGKISPFGSDRVALGQNGSFISIDIALGLFLRIKQKVKFRIVIAEEKLHHFLAVILNRSIGMGDGQRPVQSHLGIRRVIVRILEFFIQYGLDPGVLCGIDMQTAAVNRILRLDFRITLLDHQVVDHLGDDFVIKIGIRGFLFLKLTLHLDPLINVIIERFLIFRLGDIALFQHIVQHTVPAFLIVFRMGSRIIPCRCLRDRGEHRAFGKVQILGILAEISLGCRLDAVAAASEIDGIQVIFKNNAFCVFSLLRQIFFQLERQILFLELTPETFQRVFVHPVCEYIVFQKLLGDGTGALCEVKAICNTYDSSPQDTAGVYSVMLIETFVFDRHDRVLHVQRDLVDGNRNTVSAGAGQLLKLIAVRVVDKRGVSERHDIHV